MLKPPDTRGLLYEEYSTLTRYTAKFSFDVPASAIPVTLDLIMQVPG